jgi:hypothetical protein
MDFFIKKQYIYLSLNHSLERSPFYKKGKPSMSKITSYIYPILRFISLSIWIGLSLMGCESLVGDPCIADSQCGIGRICDLRSFEGYCTLPDCEENTCPSQSICVEFKNADTYCMATCVNSDECRDGYTCIDLKDETLEESIGYCGQ